VPAVQNTARDFASTKCRKLQPALAEKDARCRPVGRKKPPSRIIDSMPLSDPEGHCSSSGDATTAPYVQKNIRAVENSSNALSETRDVELPTNQPAVGSSRWDARPMAWDHSVAIEKLPGPGNRTGLYGVADVVLQGPRAAGLTLVCMIS